MIKAQMALTPQQPPVVKKKQPKSPNKPKIDRTDDIKFKKLKKQMDAERIKRLQEENAKEDRLIRSLEKKLKLNTKKKGCLPKSFIAEGLDYILDVCDYDKYNTDLNKDKEPFGFESETDFVDDFSTVLHPNADTKNDLKSSKTKSTAKTRNIKGAENSNPTEKLGKRQPNDVSSRMQKLKNFIQEETNAESDESLEDEDEEYEPSPKKRNTSKKETKTHNNLREDIYGRLINEDGTVIEQNRPTKYIPPHSRTNNDSEKLQKLRKQMKGLLNRLTGQNMHSIATQIELMYASNSRHDVNTTLSRLIQESLISFTLTPMRMIIEHALLVAVLHANIGEEVGAFILQDVAEEFQKLIKNPNTLVEDKHIDNVVAILIQLYNFKVFHACLIYEILDKLLEQFHEKDIDLILLIFKNVGFNLRKDDPGKLKDVILNVQKKANAVINEENSRTTFMLETLLAIKNNNKMKILQTESDYIDSLKKLMKAFVQTGKYISELKITFEDLLNAETKGRWWIVGSAWSGNTPSNKKPLTTNPGFTFDQKILNLAKKHRMNTEIRKNIFCILMSAEDFLDVFEKLRKLGLKGGQCQEIIYVTMHCLLQEKEYNPYYSFIAEQFSTLNRKYQITIQYCSWDKFKEIDSLTNQQITNLANFLAYLIQNKKLSISVLKVLQFTEMNKPLVKLIRQLMLNLLLSNSESVIAEVFSVLSKSQKLFMLKEGLQLFLHHFILKEANKELGNGTDDDHVQKLHRQVEVAVNAMCGGDMQF